MDAWVQLGGLPALTKLLSHRQALVLEYACTLLLSMASSRWGELRGGGHPVGFVCRVWGLQPGE